MNAVSTVQLSVFSSKWLHLITRTSIKQLLLLIMFFLQQMLSLGAEVTFHGHWVKIFTFSWHVEQHDKITHTRFKTFTTCSPRWSCLILQDEVNSAAVVCDLAIPNADQCLGAGIYWLLCAGRVFWFTVSGLCIPSTGWPAMSGILHKCWRQQLLHL